MDVRELRIGNWVEEYFVHSVVISVSSEAYGGGQVRLAENVDNYLRAVVRADVCKPIPLDENWLKKFGFESKSDFGNTRFVKGASNCSLYIMNVGKNKGICFADGLMEDIRLESVHQLQNYYFAVTGKELEILNPAQ